MNGRQSADYISLPLRELGVRVFTSVSDDQLTRDVRDFLLSPHQIYKNTFQKAVRFMEARGLLTREEAAVPSGQTLSVMFTYLLFYYFSRTLTVHGLAIPPVEWHNLVEHLFDQEYTMPHLMGPAAFFGSTEEEEESPMVQQWFARQRRVRAASVVSLGRHHLEWSAPYNELKGPSTSGRARMHLVRPRNDQGAAGRGFFKEEFHKNLWPGVAYTILSLDAYPFPVAVFPDRAGFLVPNTRPERDSLFVLSSLFPDAMRLVDADRASYSVDSALDLHIAGRFQPDGTVGEIIVPTARLLDACRANFHTGVKNPRPRLDAFEGRSQPLLAFRTPAPLELLLATVFDGEALSWNFGAHNLLLRDATRDRAIYTLADLVAGAPRALSEDVLVDPALLRDLPAPRTVLSTTAELGKILPDLINLLKQGGSSGCIDAEIIHSPLTPDGAAHGAVLRLCFIIGRDAVNNPFRGPRERPENEVTRVDAFFVVHAPRGVQPPQLKLCLLDARGIERDDVQGIVQQKLRLLSGRSDAFTMALFDLYETHCFIDVQWVRAFTDLTVHPRPGYGTVALRLSTKFENFGAPLRMTTARSWSHTAGILAVTADYDEESFNQEGASSGVALLTMAYDDVAKAYVPQNPRIVVRIPFMERDILSWMDRARNNAACFHRRWFVGAFERVQTEAPRRIVHGLYVAGFANDDENEKDIVPSPEERNALADADPMDLEESGDE